MGIDHRDDSGNSSTRNHTSSPDDQATPSTDRAPHEAHRDGRESGGTHPPAGVTTPRVDIVNYLRKTNICFRFTFESPCPFVHGMAFATANPLLVRKSYGTPYVLLPRQLFALTDEAQNLLTAWGIATLGIDEPEKEE